MIIFNKLKRIIAGILTIVVIITAIPCVSVSATKLQDVNEIAELIWKTLYVTPRDAIEPYKEKLKELDWTTAKNDGFHPNSFHNEVQKGIRKKDSKVAKKELSLKYIIRDSDGNEIEKKGKADLYITEVIDDINIKYIWEVKPISYYPERTELALEQLENYVSASGNHRPGGQQIKDGYTYLYKAIPHSGYTEYIIYLIPYIVEENGLIYYAFERYSIDDDKDVEGQLQRAPVKVKQKAKGKATSEVYEYMNEPSVNVYFDVQTFITCVTIAVAGKALYDKLNSNPDTMTSLSMAAGNACNRFLMAVAALNGNFSFAPQSVSAAELRNITNEFEDEIELYMDEEEIDALIEAIDSNDEETIEEILAGIQGENDDYSKATKEQPPQDPLIIDLGVSGIELCTLADGVNFDLDNNGFAEKTAWIGTEDGFLAYDRNGNGMIDNGGELFGDRVMLSDGSVSESGFEALAELDDNEDGLINSADDCYAVLKVWTDANHNGISDEGELKGLAEQGVISVSLEHTENNVVDAATGTRVADTADVVMNIEGTAVTTVVSEFWFPADLSDTTQGDTVTAGNIPDLMQAIAEDETGELYMLFDMFGEADEIHMKRYYLKQILYFVAGAADIEPDSRGGNIDARDLKVIEEFMGREFSGVGGSDPNTNAAAILADVYEGIENKYCNYVNMYSSLGGYLSQVFETEDEEGNTVLNLGFINYFIQSRMDAGIDMDMLIYDLGVYLKGYDEINGSSYYGQYSSHYSGLSDHCAEIVALTESGMTYTGTAGADRTEGTDGSDFIFGMAGDDVLYGSDGNDIMDGGNGNDYMHGGEGDDTYIIHTDCGSDTVMDYTGNNVLKFTDGIIPEMVIVRITQGEDVRLEFAGEEGSVTLFNFRHNEIYRNFRLEFDDGRSMYADDDSSPFKFLYGTDGDDAINEIYEGTTMYGLEGSDTLNGGNGSDALFGAGGSDYLYGSDGNDVLDGGAGADIMYGGSGDDIYVLSREIGSDTISDGSGINTLKYTDDVTAQDIRITMMGDDAILSVEGSADGIKILNFFKYDYYRNFRMEFADGTEFEAADADSPLHILYLTENDDNVTALYNNVTIYGEGGNDDIRATGGDNTLYGGEGNDTLCGKEGSDILEGGAGSDVLSGDAGADTLDGGAGADNLTGGEGDDTYILYEGCGSDIITDANGTNVLKFIDDIQVDDVKVSRSGTYDVNLTLEDSNDVITLKYFMQYDYYRNYVLEFADGTIINLSDTGSPFHTLYGTSVNDTITALYADSTIYGFEGNDTLRVQGGNNTLYGGTGDDYVYGGSGIDILYGNEGSDYLAGAGGDDILNGGDGNDYLYGEGGNDTYILYSGCGSDRITDGSGDTNVVMFTDGTRVNDISVRKEEGHLYLSIAGSSDEVKFVDFARKVAYRNFVFEFADGTRATVDLTNMVMTVAE